MTTLHGVPQESQRIQRLRGEAVAANQRLTTDLKLLDAAQIQIAVDLIISEGCKRRLEVALQNHEGLDG